MSPSSLPSQSPALLDRKQLRALVLRMDTIVSLPALAMMLLYLSRLLHVTAEEWKAFAVGGVVYSVVSVLMLESLRRRTLAPVGHYAEAVAAHGRDAIDHELLGNAFRSVMGLPRSLMWISLGHWLGAGVFFPPFMALAGFESWIFGEPLFAVLAATLTGGLIAMSFLYFYAKRSLGPMRGAIATHLADPDERRALVRPVSLARKLQFVVAGSGAASLMFTMGLAYDTASGTLLDVAVQQQVRILDAVSKRIEGRKLDSVFAELWPAQDMAPRHVELAVHSADGLPANLAFVSRSLEAEDREGRGRDRASNRLIVWRALADGRVLVAESPIDVLRAPLDGLRTTLVVVLLAALLVSFGISWLLADDVRRTVADLRAQADRMASGDLRPGATTESEDELGELARGFQRMAGALRATVGRVTEAADRVDSTAAEIASASADVATVSAEQTRRIDQANVLMVQIRGQVGEVAGSAQALNESVEESSSSILELGAAGDELNETASVLSEKVDEVSASIEEMVRSVKQVALTSEELSEAANETSSSMEEMASAMRAVDTTAEKTAELSRDVVASAEIGQTKVSETIEGMHAISEATMAAESVIQSLGSRTEEIGAILDVIDDVGDETTLLALNAAIIAAQAGEHGRAFSVVADEIKELADRVLTSSKEIGSVVRAVQGEATNAVGAIEAGSRSVASGVDLAAEAGLSLEEITRSSRESGQHIARIVTAVRDQTQAVSHVGALMDRVSSGVGEIRAAGVEQDRGNEVVFRSAVTMRDITQHVRRTTQEQTTGFARIRESVEAVREAVEQINASLQEQAQACNQIAGFLEVVAERTQSNEESVQSMGTATAGLVRQAQVLREDVARFQI